MIVGPDSEYCAILQVVDRRAEGPISTCGPSCQAIAGRSGIPRLRRMATQAVPSREMAGHARGCGDTV